MFREVNTNTKQITDVGGDSEEGTPDPIPNSAVKLFHADDTWTICPGKIGRRQLFLLQKTVGNQGYFFMLGEHSSPLRLVE